MSKDSDSGGVHGHGGGDGRLARRGSDSVKPWPAMGLMDRMRPSDLHDVPEWDSIPHDDLHEYAKHHHGVTVDVAHHGLLKRGQQSTFRIQHLSYEKAMREADARHPRLETFDTAGDHSGWKKYPMCCSSRYDRDAQGNKPGTHFGHFRSSGAKNSPLYQYGIGIVLYFRFLKWCTLVFTLLAVFNLPSLTLNLAGKGYPENDRPGPLGINRITHRIEVTTLGNLGEASTVCQRFGGTDSSDSDQILLQCPADTQIGSLRAWYGMPAAMSCGCPPNRLPKPDANAKDGATCDGNFTLGFEGVKGERCCGKIGTGSQVEFAHEFDDSKANLDNGEQCSNVDTNILTRAALKRCAAQSNCTMSVKDLLKDVLEENGAREVDEGLHQRSCESQCAEITANNNRTFHCCNNSNNSSNPSVLSGVSPCSTAEAHSIWVVARCFDNTKVGEHERSEAVQMSILFDVFGCIFLLLAIWYLRFMENKEVDLIRKKTFTMADYTVQLINVPLHHDSKVFAKDLAEHLEHVLNISTSDDGRSKPTQVKVREVWMAMSNGSVLHHERRRRNIILRAERAIQKRARIQAHLNRVQDDDDRADLQNDLDRALRRCQAVQKKLLLQDTEILNSIQHHSDKHGEEMKAVRAFVTFEQEEGRIRCLDMMPNTLVHRFLGNLDCVVPFARRFEGKTALRFSQAPPPSSIIWENLSFGWVNRTVRRIISTFMTVVLLGLHLLCAYFIAEQSISFAVEYPSAPCGAVSKELTDLRHQKVLLQTSLLDDPERRNPAELNCYCDNLLAQSLTFENKGIAAITNDIFCNISSTNNATNKFCAGMPAFIERYHNEYSRKYNAGNTTLTELEYQEDNFETWIAEAKLGSFEPANGTTALIEKKNANELAGANVTSLCQEYFIDKATAQAFLMGIAGITLLTNVVLDQVLRRIAILEKHRFITHQQKAITYKIFFSQFMNTAGVTFVFQSNLRKFVSNPDIAKPFFQGEFSDFNSGWYQTVGVALVFTMFLNIIAPHAWPMLRVVWRKFSIWRDRGYSSNPLKSRKLTQEDFEKMFRGPKFQIATRYGQILNAIFVSLAFSTGLPLLWPIAALTFFVAFWADKYLFTRFYQTPPLYDESESRVATEALPWAVLLHLFFGYAFWSYELLRPDIEGSQLVNDFQQGSLDVSGQDFDLGDKTLGLIERYYGDYLQNRLKSETAQPYLIFSTILLLVLVLKLVLKDFLASIALFCPCIVGRVMDSSQVRKSLPPVTRALPRHVLHTIADDTRVPRKLRDGAQNVLEELAKAKPHDKSHGALTAQTAQNAHDVGHGKGRRSRASATGGRAWREYMDHRRKRQFADLHSYDMRVNPSYDYVGHSNLSALRDLIDEEIQQNRTLDGHIKFQDGAERSSLKSPTAHRGAGGVMHQVDSWMQPKSSGAITNPHPGIVEQSSFRSPTKGGFKGGAAARGGVLNPLSDGLEANPMSGSMEYYKPTGASRSTHHHNKHKPVHAHAHRYPTQSGAISRPNKRESRMVLNSSSAQGGHSRQASNDEAHL